MLNIYLLHIKYNIYYPEVKESLTTFFSAEVDEVVYCVPQLQLLLLKDTVVGGRSAQLFL